VTNISITITPCDLLRPYIHSHTHTHDDIYIYTYISYVGIPTERQRCFYKFKLTSPPDMSQFPEHTEVFEVEKTMLSGPEDDAEDSWDASSSPSSDRVMYAFLRKRSQGGFHAYGLTTVKMLQSGEVVQLKCIITPHMYSTLLSTKSDPKRHVVKQRRYCFRWEHQACHVSQWLEPAAKKDLWFADIQCEAAPRVPGFLQVGPELGATASQGKEYSFREMSLKE
jgi:hypothetical protein